MTRSLLLAAVASALLLPMNVLAQTQTGSQPKTAQHHHKVAGQSGNAGARTASHQRHHRGTKNKRALTGTTGVGTSSGLSNAGTGTGLNAGGLTATGGLGNGSGTAAGNKRHHHHHHHHHPMNQQNANGIVGASGVNAAGANAGLAGTGSTGKGTKGKNVARAGKAKKSTGTGNGTSGKANSKTKGTNAALKTST